jgi:hypothetical protein
MVRVSDEDKEQSTELPKMTFDLFQVPFQFFQGDKPKKGEESEPKRGKNQRRDF